MQKLIGIIFIMMVSIHPNHSQSFKIPLWDKDNIPNHRITDEQEEIDSSDIIRISKVQDPDITVFLPSKKNATGHAVIICPGGGYRYLSYDWEGLDVAKFFNSVGIAGIVLKYRLPQSESNVIPHRSPLLDAQRAMRMVRYHAEEWNIDKQKIGIMGFSAGGHLASTLGTHFDEGQVNADNEIDKMSCRPDFMILVYPVISFNQEITHMGSRHQLIGENPDSDLVNFYSNEKQIEDNSPPAFILHAGNDHPVPVTNSLLFYEGLQEKSIPAEMHIYPKGGHGFGLGINEGYLAEWPGLCVEWLKNNL